MRTGGGFSGFPASRGALVRPAAASAQAGAARPRSTATPRHSGRSTRHGLTGLALTLGIAFAVVTAIMLVRARAQAEHAEAAARAEITTLKTELDRAVALLLAEPQVLVVWGAADDEPEFMGDRHHHAGPDSAPGAGVRHLAVARQGARSRMRSPPCGRAAKASRWS